MKILARLESKDLAENSNLAEALVVPGYKAKVERAMLLHLVVFDWNCPQHITPRFTEADVAIAVAPLHDQVSALQEENTALRARLVASSGDESAPAVT